MEFGNDDARNGTIYIISNWYSPGYFLVLVKEPTYAINGSVGAIGKKFSISFSRANTKLCLGLHCNHDK